MLDDDMLMLAELHSATFSPLCRRWESGGGLMLKFAEISSRRRDGRAEGLEGVRLLGLKRDEVKLPEYYGD